MNTAFVTANFIGGALGSALAGVLWHAGGWDAVLLGGAAALTIALLVWAANRHTLTNAAHADSPLPTRPSGRCRQILAHHHRSLHDGRQRPRWTADELAAISETEEVHVSSRPRGRHAERGSDDLDGRG